MSRYLDRILARFKRQEQKGISKYGQILEDNPRGAVEALEYAAEEVTDLLMYLEESKEKIAKMQAVVDAVRDKKDFVCKPCYDKKNCNVCILGSIMQPFAALEGGSPHEADS